MGQGLAAQVGEDGLIEDESAGQEVQDMSDEGARTGGKVARTGGERGTRRMGWMRTRVMAMGGSTEGWHGKSDEKMARKMTKPTMGPGGGCVLKRCA